MTDSTSFSFIEGADLEPDERRELLGGKGAALARMTAMGLPVPPGFVLTTQACNRFSTEGWFGGLENAVTDGVGELEQALDRRLGDPSSPLLVSVRSGAPVSMPGMMDTVLNVGLTEDVAAGLGAATGDDRFGWDTARRFIESYATIVLGVSPDTMRAISDDCLGEDEGHDLDPDRLAGATQLMRSTLTKSGFEIPADPARQVSAAIEAVFASWQADRARIYREVEGISDSLGTAAIVQAMTFGNLGKRSGTGVAFTRDPSTGAPGLVGDFLVGAQGEDVVAGTHTTLPVSRLRTLWPEVADRLDDAAGRLEADLLDLVDIEFTVEDGTLWLLQVRPGKRSPRAALRIAIDLAEDPTFPISRADALERVAAILDDPPTRLNPDVLDRRDEDIVASGLAASPGRVSGRLYTEIDAAVEAEARGERVILARRETSPADIAGMAAAEGLVTTRGGLVSHAAVVARSWGIPAVVGVEAMTVDGDGVTAGKRSLPVGGELTVDGDLGLILDGVHPGEELELEEVHTLRRWQRQQSAGEPERSEETVAPSAPDETVTVGACERVLALKGVASAETVAEVLGCLPEEVTPLIAGLVAAEDAQELPGDRVRLLPAAIERVDDAYVAAAARLAPAIEPVMDDFHTANDGLKRVVSAWQTRQVGGKPVPNDHADADYDTSVIDRLRTEVHPAILAIIDTVAAAEPRFERYRDRLASSLDAIDAGDTQMVAHPMRSSYHTVWFELHEELIRLTGRNRADEAAAGRA